MRTESRRDVASDLLERLAGVPERAERNPRTITQRRVDPEAEQRLYEAVDEAADKILAVMERSGTLGRLAGTVPFASAAVTATHAAGASAGAAMTAVTAESSKGNDEILYVGMNPDSSGVESAALGNVAKTTRVDGGLAAAPLRTAAEVKDFVAALDLPTDIAAKVEAALIARGGNATAHPEGREELAQIAKCWSAAYHGGTVPSRIVLSGHSTGDSVYGQNHKTGETRELSFAGLQSLATAMPAAAACVRHVQFAGCFTYRQLARPDKRDAWVGAFPKLETMWGYASKSPLAPVGQLRQWQTGTRGGATTITKDAKELPAGVASWDRTNGYRGNVESRADLLKKKAACDLGFEALLAGRPEITDHYDPRADGPYQICRKLEGRPDLSPAEQAEMRARGDTYLRLRYYDQTRAEFAQNNSEVLAKGCRALGIDVPDFATLGRANAMAAIRDAERVIAQKDASLSAEQRTAVAALQDRLRSFASLDGRY